MKTQVTLEGKDVRKIIAKYLEIPEEKVIPLRYNFAIEGMDAAEIQKKIESK